MSSIISVDFAKLIISSSSNKLYRLLGPLERQIVTNLLWLESPVHPPTMAAWVVREGKKYCRYVLFERC